MFFLTNLILALLALTLTTRAAPAPEVAAVDFNPPAPYDFISLTAAGKIAPAALTDANSNTVVKRNLGGVRMSDGKDFTGHVWVSLASLL